MPTPDSYPAGVDPAHIWTIATTAAPAMQARRHHDAGQRAATLRALPCRTESRPSTPKPHCSSSVTRSTGPAEVSAAAT